MALRMRDATDVEFRVITTRQRRQSLQEPVRSGDRLASVFCLLSIASLSLWPLFGLMTESFIVATLLSSAGCLVSSEWKRYAVAGALIATLLATSGCTDPRPTSSSSSTQTAAQAEDASTSIREATRYRDPRLGHQPKGIDLLSGQVVSSFKGDSVNED